MEKKALSDSMVYQEERFTKKILFQKGDSVAFVLNFLPGQQLPSHTHPGAEVYIQALKGNGTIQVNESEYELFEGEIIHLSGEETFSYRNSGDHPSSLHVVLCKIPSPAYTKEI